MAQNVVWREDMRLVLERVDELLRTIRSPVEMSERLGGDWYGVYGLLTIALDAVWLAQRDLQYR